MCVVPLFHLATRLNTQNPYEIQIRNDFREINLYMNIGNSNCAIWNIDPRKLGFTFISVRYTITNFQTL